MTESQSTPTQRVRIAGHLTQSRFLHVEDALGIGKLRIFAGVYDRSQSHTRMQSHTRHFVDLADARVIFTALARGESGFSYREYKGTPPPNNQTSSNNGAVSRVLSIAVKGDNVYIELKSGPGKLTSTGAITPNGKAQVEVNVSFKQYEAQRLAATVLAYIHAWDVYRIMEHQQLVGMPAPYLLAPAEVKNTAQCDPGSGVLAAGPQTENHDGNRPVTRKDAFPRTNGSQSGTGTGVPANLRIRPAVAATAEAIYGSGNLRYGDGSAVDAGNLIEVQAFQRFVAAEKKPPASRTLLQTYYREHIAA